MASVDLDTVVSASRSWLARRLPGAVGTAAGSVAPDWTLASLGACLAELSGIGAAASLTLVCRLVHQAQQAGEPAAWIARTDSGFFPPDVAASGIDLDVLPVIRLAGVRQRVRAAEHLVRSGAFGLVVIDLGVCLDLPLAEQTRLADHAITYGTLVICLTVKAESHRSLGSLVSVRGHTQRIEDDGDGGFICRVEMLKDKRRGPGWRCEERYRGPAGVR